jgi:hypothetical protein
MGNCKDCRYWEAHDYAACWDIWEHESGGHGECKKAEYAYDKTVWGAAPVYKDTLACSVGPACSEEASLITRHNFGCVMFEAKDAA